MLHALPSLLWAIKPSYELFFTWNLTFVIKIHILLLRVNSEEEEQFIIAIFFSFPSAVMGHNVIKSFFITSIFNVMKDQRKPIGPSPLFCISVTVQLKPILSPM